MTNNELNRIRVGTIVAERFRALPEGFAVPAQGIDMFVVRDFLDEDECCGLIRLIDTGRQPSTVLGEHPDPDYRTSESCNLDPADPLICQVERKMTALTGIDPRHGETIQGQRYEIGQQFKAHHDYFLTDQPYWPEQELVGGQRTWTAMVFLNEPPAGGQTYFPQAGVKITPRTGNLLAWNNLDSIGEPNPISMHQGLPVEAGVKYIITKWYRERPWGYQ